MRIQEVITKLEYIQEYVDEVGGFSSLPSDIHTKMEDASDELSRVMDWLDSLKTSIGTISNELLGGEENNA